ncbi:MAG: hypothetical protein RLN60_00745 [Phycisphaerales bacterium]
MIRSLLILALLWQPFAVFGTVGFGAPGDGVHGCEMSCCQIVERTSCCGERVTDEFCAKSGGACTCVGAPVREPQPRPEAPLSRVAYELVFLASVERPAIAWASIDSSHLPVALTSRHVASGRTHNEQQAFLGIWRT